MRSRAAYRPGADGWNCDRLAAQVRCRAEQQRYWSRAGLLVGAVVPVPAPVGAVSHGNVLTSGGGTAGHETRPAPTGTSLLTKDIQ